MAAANYYEQYGGAAEQGNEQEYEDYNEKPKAGNVLPVWGNARTMNINNLILTNILASPYFKVKLYELKTYHEVIDEIYYKIDNLEPWERGSRKTAGQTGMCGGVRGVGTGGIVSTSYCILYKLFTLKLTRKQLIGMLNHTDSPYIRGLGLMYIRYCQPPKDLYSWFEAYLDDEEEIDAKAGGGASMTIGTMARNLLTKLEWFDTLFPRIPVPIQKQIEEKLKARMMAQKWALNKAKGISEEEESSSRQTPDRRPSKSRSQEVESNHNNYRSQSSDRHSSRRSYDRDRERSHNSHHRSRHRDEHSHSKRSDSRERRRRSDSRERKRHSRSRSPKRSHKNKRSRSRERSHKHKHSHSHEKSHKKKHKSRKDHS